MYKRLALALGFAKAILTPIDEANGQTCEEVLRQIEPHLLHDADGPGRVDLSGKYLLTWVDQEFLNMKTTKCVQLKTVALNPKVHVVSVSQMTDNMTSGLQLILGLE